MQGPEIDVESTMNSPYVLFLDAGIIEPRAGKFLKNLGNPLYLFPKCCNYREVTMNTWPMCGFRGSELRSSDLYNKGLPAGQAIYQVSHCQSLKVLSSYTIL